MVWLSSSLAFEMLLFSFQFYKSSNLNNGDMNLNFSFIRITQRVGDCISSINFINY